MPQHIHSDWGLILIEHLELQKEMGLKTSGDIKLQTLEGREEMDGYIWSFCVLDRSCAVVHCTQFTRISLLYLPCGFQGLNSGSQGWWQEQCPYLPGHFFGLNLNFFNNGGSIDLRDSERWTKCILSHYEIAISLWAHGS